MEKGSGGPGDMSSASNSFGTPNFSAALKAMFRFSISLERFKDSQGIKFGRMECTKAHNARPSLQLALKFETSTPA
jgi:hypothetical protein